jgi:predicted transcriptional regulator of viral defense system
MNKQSTSENQSNQLTRLVARTGEFLTIDEVAAHFRCQPQTIRKNLSWHGHFHGLRPVRFGRRVLFKAEEVANAVG